jgi:hypothetical protein
VCGPATGRHPSPSSGSTRHELRSAVEKGYAVLGCRPQRRVTGPLSAERTIKRLSPAIPSSEPYFSGCYRQHRACRSKNHAETARGCGCSPAQISIAHRRCPRFPSSGAFRRRPGSRRPAHIHRPPSETHHARGQQLSASPCPLRTAGKNAALLNLRLTGAERAPRLAISVRRRP